MAKRPRAFRPSNYVSGYFSLIINRIAILFQLISQQIGEFESLGRVKARVAMRFVAVGEVAFGDVLHAAEAFGHVLAGHFKMNAARMSPFRPADREK